jgi:hypothetical protein
MSRLSRFTRLLVLIGIVVVGVSAAPGLARAERLTATFTFADGTGSPAPIRRATVEVWRKSGLFGIWSNVLTDATNEDGNLNVNVPSVGAGAEYGLRVYAINDAAIVRFRDRPTDAMYSEPGPPKAPMRWISTGASAAHDFSFDFVDLATVAYYNAADALIYGHDYALARRAQAKPGEPPIPGEPQQIKQLNVMVQSGNTFYDPAVDWLRINPGFLISLDDKTILHEYAHFLEEQLSTFMALATSHDGCNAQILGAHVESMDFAWMEGFASYFSAAVDRAFNTDTLPTTNVTGPAGAGAPPGTISGTLQVPTLESPSCPSGPFLPNAWLEKFVGGALWDLIDDPSRDVSSNTEPADQLCDKDDQVFSIFDRELQRVPANIQTFTDAWVKRGFDVPPLKSAFAAQGVTVNTPAALMHFSPSAAAHLAVWRGSDGGAWFIDGRLSTRWGSAGDTPVPADYDGDGLTDAAIYRPSTGEWWVLPSANGGVSQTTKWGDPGDLPLPGDYDGDGETDFAVYSSSLNAVLVHNDSCGPARTIDLFQLAITGQPVVGDVDGDGADDPGLYNSTTGEMKIRTHALAPYLAAFVRSATLAGGAAPAIADYNGDYKDDLATFSGYFMVFGVLNAAPRGTWTISTSQNAPNLTQTWGGAFGDIPVPADYDATANPQCDIEISPASCHTADLAVWNNFTGNWTIRRADGTPRIVQSGQNGDIPIPR